MFRRINRRSKIYRSVTAWLTLAFFLLQIPATALADPPTHAAANGVPVVDINKPSAAGISRNEFARFDVGNRGLIFNNSGGVVNTALGGYIMGNANLGANPARLILAEVIGRAPSRLNGYMEIAGQRADLIIANPNGIVGNGFGFINASRAVLTTGRAVFGANGGLDGFTVNGGTVRIEGAGLNAGGTDKVDILARAVEVNAGVWAKDLTVVTGINQISRSGGVQSVAAAQPESGIALDVGALGGMYAGKIHLIGTEDGVGVNNRGTLQSTGEFTLSSNGKIELGGSVSAGGRLSVDARGIQNAGTVYAEGNLAMRAEEAIGNTGFIAARLDAALAAKDIFSSGTLGAGIDESGRLAGAGGLSAVADRSVRLAGENLAGQISIRADRADLSGSATRAKRDIDIAAEDISLSEAAVTAGETLKLRAASAIDNRGGALQGKNVELGAADINNASGKLSAEDELRLSTKGELDNVGGKIIAGQNLALSAARIANTGGAIAAGKDLRAAADSINNGKAGKITAGGDLRIQGGALQNAGDILAGRSAALTARKSLTSSGRVTAGGDLTLLAANVESTGILGAGIDSTGAVGASGALRVQGDAIALNGQNFAGEDLAITGEEIDLRNSQSFARRDVRITANGSVSHNGGKLAGGNQVAIRAGGALENENGVIEAGSADVRAARMNNENGKLSTYGEGGDALAVSGGLDNAGGEISLAAGEAHVKAGALDNRGGKLIHTGAGALGLETRDALENARGQIATNGALTASAGNLDNRGGEIYAREDAAIAAAALHNAGGSVVVGKALTVNIVGALDNGDGTIAAASGLSARARTLANAAGGRVVNTGTETTDVQAEEELANQGLIGGNGDVIVGADAIANDGGTLQATGDLTFASARSLTNRGGKIHAGRDAVLRAAGLRLDNRGGRVEAGRDLNVSGESYDGAAGKMAAGRDLRLKAQSLVDGGALQAGENLDLTFSGDYSQSQGGVFAANGSLALHTDGNITNAGTISAVKDLSLSAGNITNEETGTLTANHSVTLDAKHTLKNDGRVDSGAIDAKAQVFQNTGSVIGGTLQVKADQISNRGAKAILAATEGMSLQAKNSLVNSDHASIYTLGDINIAADDSGGRTKTVVNESASVEAEGNIKILADALTNKRTVFKTEKKEISRKENQRENLTSEITTISLWGETKTNRDVVDKTYTEVVTGTVVVADSGTGRITAAGDITVQSDQLTNDVSEITAGKNLLLQSGQVQNITVDTERITTREDVKIIESGTRWEPVNTLHWAEKTYHHEKDAPDELVSVEKAPGYAAILQGGQSVAIQGKTLGNIVSGGDGTTVGSASTLAPESAAAVEKKKWDAAAGNAGRVDTSAESGAPPQGGGELSIKLPENGLTHINKDPSSKYLVETDRRFTDYKTFISSDYLLDRIGYDPDKAIKRLGDGFYEQQVVRDQIAAKHGGSLLDGYGSNEEQYKALLANGAEAAEEFHLEVGAALSPDQINALKKDIVWLEEKEVEGEKVLVPVVYLAPDSAKLKPNGAIIKGGEVELAITGDLNNDGQISADESLRVSAGDIFNRGGAITAKDALDIAASGDVVNKSGAIGGREVSISAGGDIRNETAAAKRDYGSSVETLLSQTGQITAADGLSLSAGRDILNSGADVSGKDVQLSAGRDVRADAVSHKKSNAYSGKKTAVTSDIKAEGSLTISAQNDVSLTGAQVKAEKDVDITAGRDVTLHAAEESAARSDYDHTNTLATKTAVGTRLEAGGELTVSAGRDAAAEGAKLKSEGDLKIAAGGSVALDTAESAMDSHRQSKGYRDNWRTDRLTVQETTDIAGQKVSVTSGGDMNLSGTQIAAGDKIGLSAGGDLNLTATKDELRTESYKKTNHGWEKKRADDEQTVGANLAAKGDITLSGDNIRVESGGIATEKGAIKLDAQNDVTIKETAEKHESESTSHTKKSGFLSSKTTNKHDYELEIDAAGSKLSGETVRIHAGNDIAVKGSAIVGTGDVSLAAGGDVTLESAANLGTEEHRSETKKSGLFSGGGFGITIGKRTEKETTKENVLSNQATTVGSVDGSVTIKAGESVSATGTDIIGGGDVAIEGKRVAIDNSTDTYDYERSYELKQSGLSVSLGGAIVTAGQKAAHDVERGKNVEDDRLKALYGYEATKDLKDFGNAAEGLNGGLKNGVSVNISIGSSKTTIEQKAHAETVNASGVKAGNSVTVTATEGDIDLSAAKVSGKDVALTAKEDIHIGDAESKRTSQTKEESSSWSIGCDIGGGITGSFGKGGSKENEATTSHTGSEITAENNLRITSGQDTDIIGSTVKGDAVKAEIGGNLNIESKRDQKTYGKDGKNVGLSAGGASQGVQGGIGKNNMDSSYDSVTKQAGIYAGAGGFDIEVGKNTDLKGAVIASEATPDKNKLSTDTITYEDVSNKAEYSASSNGININTSANAKYNEQGVTPNIGVKAEGQASSTTHSAIAEGTIEVRSDPEKDLSDLKRTTEDALNKLGEIFDKKTVEERQELAQLFGEVAFEGVHNLAKGEKEKAQAALEQAKKENKSKEEIAKLQARVDSWDEGGSNKIALHAIVGGLMADMGGDNTLSGAAGAALNETFQKELKERFKDQPDVWQWVSAAIGAAAGKVTGGEAGTGASTSASGTKNNTQAEREMALATAKTDEQREGIEKALNVGICIKDGNGLNNAILYGIEQGIIPDPKNMENDYCYVDINFGLGKFVSGGVGAILDKEGNVYVFGQGSIGAGIAPPLGFDTGFGNIESGAKKEADFDLADAIAGGSFGAGGASLIGTDVSVGKNGTVSIEVSFKTSAGTTMISRRQAYLLSNIYN